MGSKDSSHSYLHFHSSRHADLFEDFARSGVSDTEPIQVAAHLQPPNPEDEDDVVPDQHAAFGIQRATQPRREHAWRDLGMAELVAGNGNANGNANGGDAHATASGQADGPTSTAAASTTAARNAQGIVGRPGLGRGAGWTREGQSATEVGARSLPR